MNKKQAEARLSELKNLLSKYAYEYYVLDQPSVSDVIYDGLIRELKDLEEKFPDLITADSPTQRINAKALDSFVKVTHSSRMISLNDVFSLEDVEAWIKRTIKLTGAKQLEFFVDIKMDGLACALIYNDGLLSQAVTRGDGFVGEDVTMNVRTIKNIPLKLQKQKDFGFLLKSRTEIRGEIVMLKKDFENLNHDRELAGLPIFANPRNLAAGTIRQLDPKLVSERKLYFRAYDVLRDDKTELPTNIYCYQALSAVGITRNMQATTYKKLDDVMKFVHKWEEERHTLPFNTDGLVIKLNDRELYDSLGIVGKNPRGAVAYKYPAEEATSQVKDIVLSIGRTGAATPIAVFEPVIIAGTRVQHASLHNSDEIKRKDIRVGDTVVIYKAGDIIPQVDRVILELRPKNSVEFDMEKELKRQYPELKFIRPEAEAIYRVSGATRSLLLAKALEHFASKAALDIDWMGEKNVEALVRAGLVKDIADIYLISKDQLLKLDRFAELSADNLVNAIKSTKKPALARFVYGLGIRHVGAQTAIDLVQKFESIDAIETATIDDLLSIEGIGDIVAESIIAWFSDDDNAALLQKFKDLGVSPEFERVSGSLAGKSFVITGSLTQMDRETAAEAIRAKGGKFQSSVASDTSYLVIGTEPGKSKIVKAERLGITKIDEAKLLELIDK